jgi:hypothetical protein
LAGKEAVKPDKAPVTPLVEVRLKPALEEPALVGKSAAPFDGKVNTGRDEGNETSFNMAPNPAIIGRYAR